MAVAVQEIEKDQAARLLFTVDEAAALVSLSKAEMDRCIRRGQCDSVKIGRLRRISRAQLERFVEQLERGSAA